MGQFDMIIVKLISGLGNQLFQYCIGRQLSLARGTELKLDISFFKGQSLRSFKLHHYHIKAEIATEKEVSRFTNIYADTHLYAKVFRKGEKLVPKRNRRLFKEHEWWVYEPELLKASGNVYLDGYWQHYKYFENMNPSILDELTVNEPYTADENDLLSAMQENNSVSLHIRRGDYMTDRDAYNFMGVMPVEYYNAAIKRIRDSVQHPAFFIFSDDLQWAKDNIKIDAPVIHVNPDDGKKDYRELDLMSKCKHNIIANSSFSWWGAFLNRYPGKIVIAPRKWIIPEERNKKIQLQFPGWVKM